MPLLPRLSRDYLQALATKRDHQFLINVTAQLGVLERHEANARQYLLKDPTLLHFQALWQAITNDYLWLHEFLQDALIQWLQTTQKQHPAQSLLARLRRKLPTHYQQKLALLQKNYQAEIAEELAQLYTDPLFYYYSQQAAHQELQTTFKSIETQHIADTARQIAAVSADLFLQLTQEEMITPDDKRCPHFLSITHFMNHLGIYVEEMLLNTQDTNARTYLLHYWSLVVQQLDHLGDFASANQLIFTFGSGAIYRLQNSKAGLSSPQVLEPQLASSRSDGGNHFLIPFVGKYRTKLQQASDNPNAEIKAKHTEEVKLDLLRLQQCAQQLVPPALTPDNRFALASKQRPADFASDAQKLLRYQLSLQREPRLNSSPQSQLFHTQPTCLLAELRNPHLIAILLAQHQVFPRLAPPKDASATDQAESSDNSHPCLQRRDFEGLNYATLQKIDFNSLRKLIASCQLNLDIETLESIHQSNRQCYYRHQIENSVLRDIASQTMIFHYQSGLSTSKIIRKVNALLAASADPLLIDAKLQQINLRLSHAQWQQVLERAALDRAKLRLTEIERLLHDLSDHLEQIRPRRFSNPLVKAQLDDYLYLIAHSQQLEPEDQQVLRTDLTSVVMPGGYKAESVNPFLAQLQAVQSMHDQIYRLLDQLPSDNFYHQELRKRYNQLNQRLKTPYYQYLLQGFNCLVKWRDQIHSADVYTLLKKHWLEQHPWLQRLSRCYVSYERILTRVRHHSLQTLLTSIYKTIRKEVTENFLDTMLKILRSNITPANPDWPQTVAAWTQRAKTLTTMEQLSQLRREIEATVPDLYIPLQGLIPCAQELLNQISLYAQTKKELIELGGLCFNYDNQLGVLKFKDYLNVARWLNSQHDTRPLPEPNPSALNAKTAGELKSFWLLVKLLAEKKSQLGGNQTPKRSPIRLQLFGRRQVPGSSPKSLGNTLGESRLFLKSS